MHEALPPLIERWKSDRFSTYNTWFLWQDRLKNFRTIRRGLGVVVKEIEAGTFGNTYRNSSLETVVASIAEQRQIFKGADHAFLWKPKLRIPDIYEHPENQKAFGRFLDTCHCCDTAEAVVRAIRHLDSHGIKGLGPAVANLLYFIHPTLVTPFNTAIVNGFNALTGGKVKLGKWDHYLAMRESMIKLNESYRLMLSNDLGAIAGLMFDVGSGKYSLPPDTDDIIQVARWNADLQAVREETAASQRMLATAAESEASHTAVQGRLRDMGLALGFRVWIASNDRNRAFGYGRLGDGCIAQLPATTLFSAPSVKLIDVLWLEPNADSVVAAFEVEHSTSIYSGIIRMLDLAMGSEISSSKLFLVAPDSRRDDVARQLARPAFSKISQLGIRYLPYGQLELHHAAIGRFGSGLKPIMEISQIL